MCVSVCFVFRGWVRFLLETLDISVSHFVACACIAMAIICAFGGSALYVRVSGGFSLKDTSYTIFARVRIWELHVLLVTMCMI